MVRLAERRSVVGIDVSNSIIFISEDKDNLPKVGRTSDAGWDIRTLGYTTKNKLAGCLLIHTGIKYYIPDGYEIQLRMKSGTFFKTGLMLTNGIGTLDAGYRGEIIAPCIHHLIGAAYLYLEQYLNKYLFQLVTSTYIKPDVEIKPIENIYLVANKDEYDNWSSILPTDRGADGGLLRG